MRVQIRRRAQPRIAPHERQHDGVGPRVGAGQGGHAEEAVVLQLRRHAADLRDRERRDVGEPDRRARRRAMLERDERQHHTLARRDAIELERDRVPTALRDDDPHRVTIANASFFPLA
jgi:hypothetical protein